MKIFKLELMIWIHLEQYQQQQHYSIVSIILSTEIKLIW